MATSSTMPQSKPAASKRSGSTRKATGSKAAPKGKATGKAKKAPAQSKGNGKARPQYSDEVKRITEKARGIACPETRQGPVSKQVLAIMQGIGDVRAATKEVGLTRKELTALANNDSPSSEARAKLRTLAERVSGAPRWTRGRALAAVLLVWSEQR